MATLEIREQSLLDPHEALPLWSDRDSVRSIMRWYFALSWLSFSILIAVELFVERDFGFGEVDYSSLQRRIQRWWVAPVILGILAISMGRVIAFMPKVIYTGEAGEDDASVPAVLRDIETVMRSEKKAVELDLHDAVAARRLLRSVSSNLNANTHSLVTSIKFTGVGLLFSILGHFVALQAASLLAAELALVVIEIPLMLDQYRLVTPLLVSLAFSAAKYLSSRLVKKLWKNPQKKDAIGDSIMNNFVSNASYGALFEHILMCATFAVKLPMDIFLRKARHSRDDSSKFNTLVHASFLSYLTTMALGELKMWADYAHRRFCTSRNQDASEFNRRIEKVRKALAKSHPHLAADPVMEDLVGLHLGSLEKKQMLTEAMSGGFNLSKEIDKLVFATVYPISLCSFNPTILITAMGVLPLVLVSSWIRWRIALTTTEEFKAYLRNIFFPPTSAIAQDAVSHDDEVQGRQEQMPDETASAVDIDHVEAAPLPDHVEESVQKISGDLLRMYGLPAILFFCSATLARMGVASNISMNEEPHCSTTKWKNICATLPVLWKEIEIVAPVLLAFYLFEAACVQDRYFERSELILDNALSDDTNVFKRIASADRFDRSLYVSICSSIIPLASATSLVVDRCAAARLPTGRRLCRCFSSCLATLAFFVLYDLANIAFLLSHFVVNDLTKMSGWFENKAYTAYSAHLFQSAADALCAMIIAMIIGGVCMLLLFFLALVMGVCKCGSSDASRRMLAYFFAEHVISMRHAVLVTLKVAALRCEARWKQIIGDVARRFPPGGVASSAHTDAWGAANLGYKVSVLREIEFTRAGLSLKYLTGGQTDYLMQLMLPTSKKSDTLHEAKKTVWTKAWRVAYAAATSREVSSPAGPT